MTGKPKIRYGLTQNPIRMRRFIFSRVVTSQKNSEEFRPLYVKLHRRECL